MAWDIVKKLKLMVAKAEGTDSPAEAEAIMTKVRQMLDEHSLTLLAIRHSAISDDPVGVTRGVSNYWKSDHWAKKLSHAAASYYGVKVVWITTGNNTVISAVGRESCRAAYELMLPYLRAQVVRLASAGTTAGKYHSISKARTQIGTALAARLWTLHWEADRNRVRPQDISGHNMLVPVDQLAQALDEAFPDSKSVSTKSKVKITAAAIVDAKSINLADQVGGSKADILQIGVDK